MSYRPNAWGKEAAQRPGSNWASFGSPEELEWVADSAVSEYLHGANREDIVDSLHRDPSAENAASIVVDVTLHAIRVIKAAGGNIGPGLPAYTLSKAVEYVMEIHQVVNHPFADIGTVLESNRFLAKRVKHLAEKMYQTRGQERG